MMLSSLDRTAPRTPERSARRRCAGGLGLLLACVLAGGCGDDPPADAAQPVAPHRTAANESAPDADTATAVGVNLLAELGEAVQMLGRLGFAPPVPPAPRWPLDARLVRA